MIIKTFTAETSAAALKRVREEMGGDAIVLKSGRVSGSDGRPAFEVTACLEKATVGRTSRIFTSPKKNPGSAHVPVGTNRLTGVVQEQPMSDSDSALHDKISDLERKLDSLVARSLAPRTAPESQQYGELCARLRKADVLEDQIINLVKSLDDKKVDATGVFDAAREELVKHFSGIMLPSVTFTPGDRVVISGPAGSGKSSVLGKLASLLVARDRRKVRLVTLDSFKMTAFEELAGYAEILGAEMADPYAEHQDFTPEKETITLIDTPALPSGTDAVEALQKRIEIIKPTMHIAVFSCLTRSVDISRFAAELKKFAPTHLIMTMTDLTTAYGSMMAAASALDTAIAMVVDAPGGLGTLHTPDPDRTARQLLAMEVSRA